jgi:hypothetical protein
VNVIKREEALDAWNELFDENHWLEGWESVGDCNVFCCPGNPPDWNVLSGVRNILWIFGKETHILKLKRKLITEKDLA